ncbi:MAG: serine/threonine-protein kinase [Pseudomonadota bacterium]
MSERDLKVDERARSVLQRLSGSTESLDTSGSYDRNARLAERLQQIEQLFLLHGGQRSGPDTGEILFEWGHLQVLEPLGEGSFGEVYRVYDRALDRDVALKLLKTDHDRPFQSQLFLHEGRQLAMVRHRNVLAVHGAAVHDGRPGLWTDLIDGETAQDDQYRTLLSRQDDALEFIESMTLALQAVHASGLVHGDIKPGNVMRDAAGEWILMDFGASLDYRNADQAPAIASGTPLYMAPEVVLGAASNVTTDIYSMGALFYRVLVGSSPFEVRQWSELKALHESHQQAPRARLADDPNGRIGALIDRMLAIDPALRPDPGQILAEIQAIREAPHRRFRRLALGSIAVVLITGLVATSIGFFRAESALEQAQVEQSNTEAVNRFLQRILVTPSSTGRVRDLTVEDMLLTAANDTESALADQPRAQVSVRRMLAESFNVLDRPELALEQIQLARLTLFENQILMPDLSRRLDLFEIRAAEIEGRHEESLVLIGDFMDRHFEALGDDHPRIRWARLYQITNLITLSRHQEALTILENHFAEMPSPEPLQQNYGYGVLQSWVGVYAGLGRVQDTLARAQGAVDWLRQYPVVHPFNEIDAMFALASALSDANQHERAIEVLKQLLPLIERVYSRDSREYIAVWINLAAYQRESGQVDEAQETMEQGLDLMRRFPGSSTITMELTVQMNLANLINANGDAQRAETMMRENLSRMLTHLGPTHQNTLIQQYNLAELLNDQGRHEEARVMAEQTVASKRETLGPTHQLTLMSMDNLAVALRGLGRGEEAIELHNRALASMIEQLGQDHPNSLLLARNRLATLVSVSPEQIEPREIEAMVQRHEQALGDDHFDTKKARALLY